MARGYLEAFEVGPDGILDVHVAATTPTPELAIRRLIHADAHPDGPGVRTEDVCWRVTELATVREHDVTAGSCAVIEGCLPHEGAPFMIATWIWPTDLRAAASVASWRTSLGTAQLALVDNRLTLEIAGEPLLVSPHRLHERQWHFVAAAISATTGFARIAWGQLGRTGGPYELTREIASLAPAVSDSSLVLGGTLADDGVARGAFDGKLHAPLLLGEIPDAIGLMELMNWGLTRSSRPPAVLARWEFGDAESLATVVDTTGSGRHGRLLQAPTLGVTPPPSLAGTIATPPIGPPYATVHLHRDDLEDCGWPATHRISVPSSARSGFYSLSMRSQDGDIELPFVVTPSTSPQVLLLAPTYTWQAYANLGRDPERYPGLSHYALHADGSPVYVTTRLKPSPTLEPGARMEVESVDGFSGTEASEVAPAATHLLMADLYANFWLEHSTVDFGVITDGLLDQRGLDCLAQVRVLVLSAHPEYWTRTMLDTLDAYLSTGGSVIYLGGNGLYWVTSIDPKRPYLMEVRRSCGSQTWNAEPGEVHHVFERQPGGTWAGRGRPPDKLVSVGFAGFGWDTGIPYRRTAASYGPEFSWVFAGVAGDTIGERGLNLGGAVAFEFDRHDPNLAPSGTTVLATAAPAGGFFFRSFEDGAGRAPDPETRADMTIRHTPSGGTVFSLGSVTASGALPVQGGDNDFARVCTNVLSRMLS
ncbi:MAG: hypothetical protein JWO62_652 [Acidimicrobiaceae bacterium]|nr:hypothetical protein [Acidimicrobiaceae bacterium]